MQLVMAKFGRGEGLGNRLFPFSRALIYAKQYNLPYLRPLFENLKYKTFRMGGISYGKSARKILLLDNFYFQQPNYIDFFSSLKMSVRLNHISEPENLLNPVNIDNCIIDFSKKRTFDILEPYRKLIKDEIYSITKPKWVDFVTKADSFPIAMNIRMGNDFNELQMKYSYFQDSGIKTPLNWYKKTLNIIREIKGYNVPVMIITDGTARQLKLLLDMPEVYFIQTPAAITDLLLLSKAKFLLCSGGSTFSCWASFLDKQPTLTFPGQHPNKYLLSSNISDHFVGEFDPLLPEEEIIRVIQNINLSS